jgi:hypothetical protein
MHSCASKDIKKKKRNEGKIRVKENNGRRIRGRGGNREWRRNKGRREKE